MIAAVGLSATSLAEPSGSDRDIGGDRDNQSTKTIPTQFVAKQYSELLGRTPTAAEWDKAIAFYEKKDCSLKTLQSVASDIATSSEFLALYPAGEPADIALRTQALVRAARNRDMDATDWSELIEPQLNGKMNWKKVVEETYADTPNGMDVSSVCAPGTASYGFAQTQPLDILASSGTSASRTQAELQMALDGAGPGGVVELRPGEVVRVGDGSGITIPAGTTLSTPATPSAAYARMGRIVPAAPATRLCEPMTCNESGLVSLNPGAVLRNVWVDGRGLDPGLPKVANVEIKGSTTSAPSVVDGSRITDPVRGGAAIRDRGAGTGSALCAGERIAKNLISGYSSVRELDTLGEVQAVEGIAVSCEFATVELNQIIDVTNAGVTLRGSFNRYFNASANQASLVTGNVVLSAGLSAHTAFAADPVGTCRSHRDARVVPCIDLIGERSFAGASVTGNSFFTGPRTSFDVGLLVGGGPLWGDHRVMGRGASFSGNFTPYPARVNMGVAVLGMNDATVIGNALAVAPLDTNEQLTWGKCPVAQFVSGSAERATLRTDAAPLIDDTADGCITAPPPRTGLEPIAPSADGAGFVGAVSGRPFVPWGMNYAQQIETWWNDDWDRIVSDFRDIRNMGNNTVRVILQFDAFVDAPSAGNPSGTPNQNNLARLGDLADLASQTGLYLDVTGLGLELTADTGTWYDNLDEASRWESQALWWSEVASRLAGKSSVAWYDLMNEPAASARTKTLWCTGARVGGFCWSQRITLTPDGRSRVEIGRAWARRLVDAIRVGAGDTRHPISVGLLPYGNSGFRQSDLVGILDFGLAHMYPRADDPATAVNEFQLDLADIKASKVAGQPLVIEEVSGLRSVDATVEAFILGSRPEAGGWLSHFLGSTPSEVRVTLSQLAPWTPAWWAKAFHLVEYQMRILNALRFNPGGGLG